MHAEIILKYEEKEHLLAKDFAQITCTLGSQNGPA